MSICMCLCSHLQLGAAPLHLVFAAQPRLISRAWNIDAGLSVLLLAAYRGNPQSSLRVTIIGDCCPWMPDVIKALKNFGFERLTISYRRKYAFLIQESKDNLMQIRIDTTELASDI